MRIIPRDIDPKSKADITALDVILDENRTGNVRLADDYIMVVDSGDQGSAPDFQGVIVARPVLYLHELRIKPEGSMRRIVAENLVAYALSKGAMLGERYAHFTVAKDNRSMLGFIDDHGGIPQPDGVLFELPIPRAFYRGKELGK